SSRAGLPSRGPPWACTTRPRCHWRGIAASSQAPLPSRATWQLAMSATWEGHSLATKSAGCAAAGADRASAAAVAAADSRRRAGLSRAATSERLVEAVVPIAPPRLVQGATIAVLGQRGTFIGDVVHAQPHRGAVGEAVLAVEVGGHARIDHPGIARAAQQ